MVEQGRGAAGPTRLGLTTGAGLAVGHAVMLAALWAAGVADDPTAMSVFYLFTPAAIAVAAVRHARARGKRSLAGALGAGAMTALIGGVGFGLATAAVLFGLNGGEGPPLIAARIAEVEAAAATAPGDVEAALARLRAQMDPVTHSAYAGLAHVLFGVVEAAFIAPLVWIALKRRSR